jgi:hypothetical protein
MRIKRIAKSGETVFYRSQQEAKSETGIAQETISRCINGKVKTAGGFKWEAV